jgi:carbon-monoxide dehydrogenase medium subunit
MSALPELSYFRPRDLREALTALARPRTTAYAGGTDLIIALSARRSWAKSVHELIDIKGLDEANGMTDLGEHLRIGTLVTAAELASSPLVRREAPVLAQAAALTSAPVLRRRGTVGGNVMTPHPAGDIATALLALDATVDVADSNGTQELSLTEVIGSKWPRGRLILTFRVRKRRRSRFEKLASRSGFGRSLVAVALSTSKDDVCVALGGMHARPFRTFETAAAITGGTDIAAALARECRPPDDGFATMADRIKLSSALIRRALTRLEQR